MEKKISIRDYLRRFPETFSFFDNASSSGFLLFERRFASFATLESFGSLELSLLLSTFAS